MAVHELSVFDIYQPTDEVTTNQKVIGVEHRLFDLIQSVRHNIRTRKPSHKLSLTQGIVYRRSIANLTVGSTLNFWHSLIKLLPEQSVVSGFFLWQTIGLPKWELLSHYFDLEDEIVGHASTGFYEDFDLDDEIEVNMVRSFSISDTLELESGVVGYLPSSSFNALDLPINTQISQVKFSFRGTERYFRKPDFGDRYTNDFTKINQRSRGGDLIISAVSYWPKTQNLTLPFSYLTQADVDWLLDFFKISLGKRIRYLNYDGVEWEGFITNPQAQARQTGRSNFTIEIEFVGEPVV